MASFAVVLIMFISAPLLMADGVVSDAGKLGANAGAMTYCRDNFKTEDDDGRYNLLVIQTTKEFGDLTGEDKAKALITRKAAEDGDYLGKKLNKKRCASIRKILLTKYAMD
ncbi:MAG: hypothetical protein N2A97_01255 [Thermodesulfobacteriales bacterium]|jgi:hypothetical protein